MHACTYNYVVELIDPDQMISCLLAPVMQQQRTRESITPIIYKLNRSTLLPVYIGQTGRGERIKNIIIILN